MLGDLSTDGGSLSPKERSALAVMVLRSGIVVTPSELADAVWGDDLPSTWRKQVQAFIGHIRRALGTESIITSRAGYRLGVSPDAIDAPYYEALVKRARDHRSNGDPLRSIDLIERASALWAGTPYSDLGDWAPAVIEAERLGELRLAAEEELQAARLDIGEQRLVVGDAERLVREQPLRERRWAILATALYRSGRQADALASLRAARTRFADDLGIDPSVELTDLESAILRHDAALDAPRVTGESHHAECPYRGLQAFRDDDADQYFGREDDIRAAVDRLDRTGLLFIAGPSGCGKSSMVLAGLVPTLRRRGRTVVVLGSGQLTEVRLRDALSTRSLADVIVIDQFEELFHDSFPPTERAACSALIAGALDADRSFVMSVRSDFLDACAAEPNIGPSVAEHVHLLRPITADGLRRAIEEPARMAGLRLESGVVEIILRDAAGEPGALPHVSHALVETWLRREGSTLTVAGYEESGGISGAIAQSADRLYRSLDAAQQSICRSTMLRLVEVGADGSAIRRRVPLKPLRADQAHDLVLMSLARARLVSAEEDSVVIAHESLAIAWPRLAGWLAADADGARTMNAVANAAATWDGDGQPDDDLLRGARLQGALEWRSTARPELTGIESAFLEASDRREQDEADAQIDRARRDRRQNRRLRALLGVAVGLLVIAIVGTGSVVAATQETARQREAAVVEAVAATSFALRASERDVAALIAAEAYRRWPDDARARGALLATFTRGEGLLGNRYIPGAVRIAGDVIPGSRHAVIVRDNETAGVFDLDSGALIDDLQFGDPPSGCCAPPQVMVSDDGITAVVLRPTDGAEPLDPTRLGEPRTSELLVIDLATRMLRRPPIRLDLDAGRLELSPDGQTAAVADTGSYFRVALVDLASGSSRDVAGYFGGPMTPQSPPTAIAFMPDGSLVIGSTMSELAIADPAVGDVARSVHIPAMGANVAMASTRSGRLIAAGEHDLVSVDVASGEVLWTRQFTTSQPSPCAWVAVAEPASKFYCADLVGGIEEHHLESGEPTGRQLDPQLGAVGPISVSTDGRELTSIGAGSAAVTTWRLDGTGPITRMIAHGSAAMAGYGPDGSSIITAKRLAGATLAGELTEHSIWNTETDREMLRVPGTSRNVGWAGGDAIIGLFDEIDRAGFLVAGNGTHAGGDPVDSALRRSWLLDSGARLYTTNGAGAVAVYDGRTHRRLEPTMQFDGVVEAISGTEDASLLAVTVSRDERSKTLLVDGHTGAVLSPEIEGPAVSVIANPNLLITGDANRLARYDVPNLAASGSLAGVRGGLSDLQVGADGRTLLAVADDETVSLYDLASGIRLGDPIATSSPLITSAYLRPDGRELLVNMREGIAVWNLDPDTWFDAACRLAGRNLTPEEWATHFGAIAPYRETCD